MPVNVPPTNCNEIASAVRPYVPREFTGQIILHVGSGSINVVEVRQSFKPEKESAR